MTVNEMTLVEMTVVEMTVNEMTLVEMSVNEIMTLVEMTVDQITCCPPKNVKPYRDPISSQPKNYFLLHRRWNKVS